ncbi:hypothetical protein [Guggenheimella bovis]
MKRILSLLLIVAVVFGLMACNQGPSPKDTVTKAFEAMKAMDFETLSKYSSKAPFTKEDMEQLKKSGMLPIVQKMMSSIEYKILDEKVEGDKATVNVELSMYGQEVASAMTQELLPAIMAGGITQDSTPEDIEKKVVEALGKMDFSKFKKETTKDAVELKKVDGEWKIESNLDISK